MKIALLGYGKMGKTIEKWAKAKGDTVVFTKSSTSENGNLEAADVAIEFSSPEAAVENIHLAFDKNIPVVCGTTGWLSHKEDIEKEAKNRNIGFIYASNFSVGVNLFFNLNSHLAKLMQPWDEYDVSLQEIHHTEKKDAPSGTAISIAEGIFPFSDKKEWSLNKRDNAIHIDAIREADVKGTHQVDYTSDIDTLSITHTAHSRDGFAKGALIAAAFLIDKKGIFTMKEVLGL